MKFILAVFVSGARTGVCSELAEHALIVYATIISSLQDGSLFSFIGIFQYKFIKFISLKLFFGSAQPMKVSARCQ